MTTVRSERTALRAAGHGQLARRGLAIRLERFHVALVVLGIIVAVAFLAPPILGLDPYEQNLRQRLMPPFWLAGGSREHLLGTDQLGRDILVRLIAGARISLSVGLGSMVASATLGVALGLVSGYGGGWRDMLIMRAAEVQMTFPFVVLALIVMVLFEPNILTLVGVFMLAGWPLFAKVTRGLAWSLKTREFIDAARVIGCTTPDILLRHVLPNCLPYILVLATLQLPVIIFAEAGLSFLGVGFDPPEPSWGVMLGEGRDFLSTAWWLATLPGLAMMFTVMIVNYIGDSLGNRLGPRHR